MHSIERKCMNNSKTGVAGQLYITQVSTKNLYPRVGRKISSPLSSPLEIRVFTCPVKICKSFAQWKTHEWWRALKEAAEEHGYKLVYIVVYRRLYEWLPSAWQEVNSGAKGNPHWKNWPTVDPTAKRVQPIYPAIMSSEYIDLENGVKTFMKWTPDYLYPTVPDFIDTRIMNMYDPHNT